MLLAIDIGNTHTKLSLYDDRQQLAGWRLATNGERTADEFAVTLAALMRSRGLEPARITAVAICSVVPPALVPVVTMVRRDLGLEPLVLGPETDTGMPVAYENPRELGADRIANAVAARAEYGAPVIVVDLGTATKWEVVSPEGVYLGGAIAPGVAISLDALFGRAARLSRIELARPRRAIGRSTVEALRAGVLYGYAGQIDAVVDRIQSELGCPAPVVATGGLAGLIAPESRRIQHVDPHLTLKGLRWIYQRQRERARRVQDPGAGGGAGRGAG
ncbi:type III pantothenate kinase [Thermaerobacter subterraneus]|uniref:Type III pantothenate kinase n=1 Tax=Thermaerobacter subterraneus DSM 13965 TaxID=867903 RepID=K6Q457_9FIRM|nr:type III pantothenate kinase [Thermaerobacter subterraneus]EKP95914.1 pantothenate kinase, type III [Thermaerobacter subterraneus DSM 13965]